VIPSSNVTTVLSAKLLNPLISNDFNLTFLFFYTRELTLKRVEIIVKIIGLCIRRGEVKFRYI